MDRDKPLSVNDHRARVVIVVVVVVFVVVLSAVLGKVHRGRSCGRLSPSACLDADW